jgi:hypothetical protein
MIEYNIIPLVFFISHHSSFCISYYAILCNVSYLPNYSPYDSLYQFMRMWLKRQVKNGEVKLADWRLETEKRPSIPLAWGKRENDV